VIVDDGSIPSNYTPIATSSSELSKVQARVRENLSNKVREQFTTFCGPTFLGEIRGLIQLVKRPADLIYRLFRDTVQSARRTKERVERLKRMKRPKHWTETRWEKRVARKIHMEIEKLNSTYLEYTFAVLPLMSDVQDYVKALQEWLKEFRLDVRERESSQLEGKAQTIYRNGFQLNIRSWNEYKVEAIGKIKQEVTTPVGTLASLSDQLGFTWPEFRATLWELIPFSFVVDYFTNISGILNAAYASTAYLSWVSTTSVVETHTEMIAIPVAFGTPPSGGYDGYLSSTPNTTQRVGYTHRINKSLVRTNTLPPMSIQFSWPSNKQWFNVASLVGALTALNSSWRHTHGY
jgi:hypothetical protein